MAKKKEVKEAPEVKLDKKVKAKPLKVEEPKLEVKPEPVPEPPKPEVKAEEVSPTGKPVGLSALLNLLPPWAMHVLIGLAVLAGLVVVVAKSAPTLLPPGVGDAAQGILAALAPLMLASVGARK